MNTLIRRHPLPARRRQRGAAAIEFVLVFPILLIAMAPLILYARYMWHYTVAQKAAQDAARYMSTVSAAEMKSRTLATDAKSIAIEIARREVADLSPGEAIVDADVICDTNTCGFKTGTVPKTVTVSVAFHVFDTFFNSYLGPYGMPVEANVTMRYAGK
jgi:Flp pilus assembly protein TadG